MIHLVRVGYERGHGFQGGEDAEFFPVGMERQNLVEEPETLHCQRQPRCTARSGERGAVDGGHVCSQGVVDHGYDVDRRNHDCVPPCERLLHA